MICRTYRQGTPSLTARSPMCLQPHPPQVKMTPPHGWLIPLLHPARITLPMPPSAGQHCPTGSQSNSFNKQGSRCQLVPKPPTARSPMCLQPHPPQVKMTPPHGWLIPLLPPARITLPMPPSAGQHCPTGSQSNSFNKQGSRCQLVPKPPTARSPMCLQPHPPQVKMTPPHGWLFHSSIQRGSHCQCLHRQDNTAPRVVNPTHSTSKDQDANLSPSHRQHGRRCAFNHIHHR